MKKNTLKLLLILSLLCNFFPSRAVAQPKPPDRKYLFIEDQLKKEKKQKSKTESKIGKEFSSIGKDGDIPFDVDAKTITFDSSGDKILADGGVMITYSSMVIEAIKGVIDLKTNEAQVSGDVRVSDSTGTISADSAKINLKAKTGVLQNADVYLSEDEFQLKGKEIEKVQGEIYKLKDAEITTCRCAEADDCNPWRIRANRMEIERNGYGQAWGAKFDVFNIPMFYTPYLIFPAKTQRQTGLLAPSFGLGRRSGFNLELPFFWNINDSTDATITTIYESNVRYGLDTEFRKVFSRNSKLQTGLIYLNESQRDEKLLGTDTSALSDKKIDTDRIGGYLRDTWKGTLANHPFQFIAKGGYVSDDSFLREYENDKIGKYNLRNLTSKATLRTPLPAGFSFNLSSEFNQSLVSDDDFVLQRLPEASVSGIHFFNPFGENPLGLKLVTQTELKTTGFQRQASYDGNRSEAVGTAKIPFHYMNLFDGSFDTTLRGSQYSLDEVKIQSIDASGRLHTDSELPSSSSRVVPTFKVKLDSAIEKVFDLEEGSFWKRVTELGNTGRNQELARIKHTIEPGLRYKFVPFVEQDNTPQFDSLDHLSQKNVFTYQLVQRLFGRFQPRDTNLYGIEEVTPDVQDLGGITSTSSLLDQDFGFNSEDEENNYRRLRKGSLKELVTFKLGQSYDILEADKDRDAEREPLSDVSGDLILYPNDYFAIRQKINFDQYDQSFSSYSTEVQLEDKRGDRLRTRLNFISDAQRQLESHLELKITENLKFGYYTRYDDLESEIIESKVGLRYLSKCKCYIFDVNFSDRINPDETKVTFNVTFNGLGELNQRYFPDINNRKKNNP